MSRARRIGVLVACAAVAVLLWLLARGTYAPAPERDEAMRGAPEAPPPAAATLRGGSTVVTRGLGRKGSEAADERATLRIRGRVTVPDGEILPAGYVVAHIPGTWGPSSDPVPWAADGTFRLDWMPATDVAPEVVQIRAGALGWNFTSESFPVREMKVEDALLRLGGNGEVVGMIVDEAGRPLAGVLLGARDFGTGRSPAAWPDLLVSEYDPEDASDPPGWARTDAYGRFRIRGVVNGSGLEAIGSDPVWKLRGDPLGEEGEAATTWVAVPGLRMQAHVNFEPGPRPAFGLELGIHDGESDWINGSSGGAGERGWYQYVVARDSLPPGPFRVMCRLLSNECEPWSASVTAQAKDGVVTFEVPARRLDPSSLGWVSVTLPRPHLEAMGFNIARRVAPGGEWWVLRGVQGPEGETLWEVPTGIQELRVSLLTVIGEPLAWTEKVSVLHDGVNPLKPVFTGYGSLRIRGSQEVEADSRATVTIHDGKRAATFSLSRAGLVVPALAAGTYSLHLSAPLGRSKDHQAVVQAARETVVDFGEVR